MDEKPQEETRGRLPRERGVTGSYRQAALVAACLVLLNVILAAGGIAPRLVFDPAHVRAGEWWRIFTHPFIHVGWYNLLLDAGAFALLFTGLEEPSYARRFLYAAGACLGSLAGALTAGPILAQNGFSGLSGIAHGLMAVQALEILRGAAHGDRRDLRVGLFALALVVGKTIWEAATGRVLFAEYHLGPIGIPIAACHAGGVAGGILAYSLSAAGQRFRGICV